MTSKLPKRPLEPVRTPLPHIDPKATIENSKLGSWTDIGPHTTIRGSTIGDYTYISKRGSIIFSDIGKFCAIASYARFNPGNHPTDRVAQHRFTYRTRLYDLGEDEADFFQSRRDTRVTLGPDVWAGHNVTVLPGINVGAGAVLAAGAVVAANVDPFVIVGGIPAKPIKTRFNARQVEDLMRLGWWDWPHQQIKEALQDFRDLSIDAFIEKHGV